MGKKTQSDLSWAFHFFFFTKLIALLTVDLANRFAFVSWAVRRCLLAWTNVLADSRINCFLMCAKCLTYAQKCLRR